MEESPSSISPSKRIFPVLLSGIPVLVILCITLLLPSSRFNSDTNPSVTPTPNMGALIPPSPTPAFTNPTIPPRQSPSSTNSLLFHPIPNKISQQTNPTFTGKIFQTNQLVLDASYGSEISAISHENMRMVRFFPGKLKNVEFLLDGQPVQDVFGFPQYPTIDCEQEISNPDGTKTIDPQTGDFPKVIHSTLETCLKAFNKDLPPVLFYFNSPNNLNPGRHTLKITLPNNFSSSYTFTIDPNISPVVGNLPVLTDNPYSLFSAGDSCSEGWWYDQNHLPLPLSNHSNSNLVYSVSFPQSQSEFNNSQHRQVFIKLGNNFYPLIFPNHQIAFSGKSFGFLNQDISPKFGIFLPKNNLYFSNGSPASPFKTGSGSVQTYFELYPTDTSGKTHLPALLWSSSTFSGCDG